MKYSVQILSNNWFISHTNGCFSFCIRNRFNTRCRSTSNISSIRMDHGRIIVTQLVPADEHKNMVRYWCIDGYVQCIVCVVIHYMEDITAQLHKSNTRQRTIVYSTMLFTQSWRNIRGRCTATESIESMGRLTNRFTQTRLPTVLT